MHSKISVAVGFVFKESLQKSEKQMHGLLMEMNKSLIIFLVALFLLHQNKLY